MRIMSKYQIIVEDCKLVTAVNLGSATLAELSRKIVFSVSGPIVINAIKIKLCNHICYNNKEILHSYGHTGSYHSSIKRNEMSNRFYKAVLTTQAAREHEKFK